MQCPLSKISCCCLTPKFIFLVLGFLGLTLGVLSAFWPERSIGLYQWIMERFNWRVAPIDDSREVRNTRILGILLASLSLAMLAIAYLRF